VFCLLFEVAVLHFDDHDGGGDDDDDDNNNNHEQMRSHVQKVKYSQ
jgi:hypothetical protein